MIRRPIDERPRQRLAAGYLVSLLIHALSALLFFSVITSSSEQSSTEATEGSPMVIVSRVRVSVRTNSVPPVIHPPLTHAPRIPKPLAHPVLAGHRAVPTHRELAKNNPKAPPNPTPAPVAPFSPNPQQTQVAVATPAPAEIAAVPVNIPTAPPAIAEKPVAPRPTAAPPTAAPSAKPSPAPVAQVTAKPVPATARPSAAPTQVPATAAPRAVASASPAPVRTAGIQSPAPTGAPSTSPQHGLSPTAGPKALASAGPLPVAKTSVKPQAPRPIALPPTPSPEPTRRPTPAKTAPPKKQGAYNDLNARLRGLLPSGPVIPTTKRYSPGASGIGYVGDPTPPPQVVAKTLFLYESQKVKGVLRIFGGQEERIKMYVTTVKRHGAISTCTGWLIRFPPGPDPYRATAANGPFHGGAVISANDNPGPRPENGFMPIVEENATFECETSRLQPFVPSAAPSPAP